MAEAVAERGKGLTAVRVRGPAVAGAAAGWPVTVRLDAAEGGGGEAVLEPTERSWDFSASSRLEVELSHEGVQPVRVQVRVESAGPPGGPPRAVRTSADVEPGERLVVDVPLPPPRPRVPPGALVGMWGLPEEAMGDTAGRVDAARVTRIAIGVAQPAPGKALTIQRATPHGPPPPPPPAPDPTFFPMVDPFGQFIHRDWPGKVTSVEDLRRRVAQEHADLTAHPAAWDEHGGWADGPRLEATGYFRTARHDGRWWLVTPTGRLYFAHGINAVGEHDYTPLTGREHYFAHRLWEDPVFAAFLRQAPVPVVRGHYQGQRPQTFSFHQANLLRKYGPDWRHTYADLAHRRLRSWGLNAIGTWSDRAITRHPERRTPYFELAYTSRARSIEGSSGWWRKFPDPFDPGFVEAIVASFSSLQQSGVTDDPWCIGFFVDNENTWKHDTYLAEAALQSPADQPAKLALVDDLRARYGDVAALNAAWRTGYASWDDLLAQRGLPADLEPARPDLRRFYARLADAYFAGCRAAVKSVAPNHLYLGCRFPYQVNGLVTDAARRHCDAVSVNWYQFTVDGFEVPGGLDLPLIIGEYQFGALDRGLFHTGLRAVANQDERAAAYSRYVTSALRHPNVVGVTWFKFSDEPNTGRWLDTENYQIGFLDVCDSPYPETVEAARSIGRAMYETRARQ